MSRILRLVLPLVLLASCADVDVTKTAKGYYDPTPASNIEIMRTRPEGRQYFELGVVSASGFGVGDVAEMHNVIREKSATLGAHAVILTGEGITGDGLVKQRWCTGAAIRWGSPEF